MTLAPEVGLMTCVMSPPPLLAEWAQAHPQLTVARWSCRLAERREMRA